LPAPLEQPVLQPQEPVPAGQRALPEWQEASPAQPHRVQWTKQPASLCAELPQPLQVPERLQEPPVPRVLEEPRRPEVLRGELRSGASPLAPAGLPSIQEALPDGPRPGLTAACLRLPEQRAVGQRCWPPGAAGVRSFAARARLPELSSSARLA
jgi:hypothetical protein